MDGVGRDSCMTVKPWMRVCCMPKDRESLTISSGFIPQLDFWWIVFHFLRHARWPVEYISSLIRDVWDWCCENVGPNHQPCQTEALALLQWEACSLEFVRCGSFINFDHQLNKYCDFEISREHRTKARVFVLAGLSELYLQAQMFAISHRIDLKHKTSTFQDTSFGCNPFSKPISNHSRAMALHLCLYFDLFCGYTRKKVLPRSMLRSWRCWNKGFTASLMPVWGWLIAVCFCLFSYLANSISTRFRSSAIDLSIQCHLRASHPSDARYAQSLSVNWFHLNAWIQYVMCAPKYVVCLPYLHLASSILLVFLSALLWQSFSLKFLNWTCTKPYATPFPRSCNPRPRTRCICQPAYSFYMMSLI